MKLTFVQNQLKSHFAIINDKGGDKNESGAI